MRHRKRLLLLLLVLLIALTAGYVVVLLPGRTDANLMAKFQQVEVGMSLDDLKALIGNPTGFGQLKPGQNKAFAVAIWESGDTQLYVAFDDKWKVTTKRCGTMSLGQRLNRLMDRITP